VIISCRGLEVVFKLLNKLAKALLDISSIWLLGVMLLIGADVFMRYTFAKPIPGTLEISEQTVVILTFLCFAYTGMQNRHIRTDAIIRRCPPPFRTFTEFLSAFLMLLMLSLMIWQTSKEAWEAICIREVRMGLIEVPIYPTKIAISVGLSVAWVYYLLNFIRLFKQEKK
jgi:TRAP-type C4-dicarboxylate transport system permease small subunit